MAKAQLFSASTRRIATYSCLTLIMMLFVGCGADSSEGGSGNADSYPVDKVEFVVPYSPGGGYDAWARLLAPYIEKYLPGDVTVVVTNVPGGGTQVAARQMYAAPPDGSQIQILQFLTLAAFETAGDPPFELRKFTYLGRITRDPTILYVAGDSNLNSLEDFQATESPIKQAIASEAAIGNLITVTLYEELGIEYSTVRHSGSSEMVLSVIRHDTDASSGSVESYLTELRSGELKPILYIGDKPQEGEPSYDIIDIIEEVPTLDDIGYPELRTILEAQRILAAPPGLPADVRQMLDQAIQSALNDPELLEQARQAELTVAPLDSQQTTELVTEILDNMAEYEEDIKKAISE